MAPAVMAPEEKGLILLQEAVLETNSFRQTAAHSPAAGRVPPKKKIQRVRIAWFILGMTAGILATVLVGSAVSYIRENDSMNLTVSSADAHVPPAIENTATSEKIEAAEENADAKKAETELVASAQEVVSDPNFFELEVRRGDTLSDMLSAKGVSRKEAHDVIEALRKHYNPRSIVVGQKIGLTLNETKFSGAESDFDVSKLEIKTSKIETLQLTQPQKGQFGFDTQKMELSEELRSGGGQINSSLYQTGIDTGVPPAILSTLINAYSYDVDFQRDIKRGDHFNVIFEALKTDDDEVAAYGKILFANLKTGGEEIKVYHFTREDGTEGFYDENGQSIRKALLMTPINGARLSSGFGMRKHPILGYSRMHKGTDFAAPRGTPVYAAGDGVVDYSGRKGSYGKYVRIRHNNEFSTAYAHLNKIASKAKNGQRVKQGQVIGYVGSTGASTGPHLHYEVLKAGQQVNPKKIKLPTGHKLKGKELAEFQRSVKQVNLLAARMIDGNAAMASVAH